MGKIKESCINCCFHVVITETTVRCILTDEVHEVTDTCDQFRSEHDFLLDQ